MPDPLPEPQTWQAWLWLFIEDGGWRQVGPRGWMLLLAGTGVGGSAGLYLCLRMAYALGTAAVDHGSFHRSVLFPMLLTVLAGMGAATWALAPLYWRLPWWAAAAVTAGLCRAGVWLWSEDWRLVWGLVWMPEAI